MAVLTNLSHLEYRHIFLHVLASWDEGGPFEGENLGHRSHWGCYGGLVGHAYYGAIPWACHIRLQGAGKGEDAVSSYVGGV